MVTLVHINDLEDTDIFIWGVGEHRPQFEFHSFEVFESIGGYHKPMPPLSDYEPVQLRLDGKIRDGETIGDIRSVNLWRPVVSENTKRLLPELEENGLFSVSYTHLTLPTICSV